MKNTVCRGRRPRRPVKRIISLILSLIMLSSITAGLDFSAYALASSGSCGDNVIWTFNSSTNTLTISGTGAMSNYKSSGSPFYNQTSIKKVVINSGVTSIGDYAFYYCTGLTSITIPDSVTSIGKSAFYNCTGLTSITIPDSVTSIGNSAFNGCTGLKELTMPCSAKIFNSQYGFENCTNIEKVTLTKGSGIMQNYGTDSSSSATGTCYQYTPWYISRNKLKTLILEDGITSIVNYAFKGCTRLTSVTIPDSVTSIGNSAFYGCTGLISITFPDNVTNIGGEAFSDCTGLASITIPDSVTSIKIWAFNNCTKLKNVYYTGSETEWNNIITNTNSLFHNRLTDADVTINYYYQVSSKEPCITHIWNSGTTSLKPTCTKIGYKTYTCTMCDATKKEELSPGHSYNNGVITTQPTCVKAGIKIYTCTACGNTKTENVPASGHSFNNGIVTTQPTCVKAGEKTFTCTVCGSTKTESVPATGIHTYNSGTITTQPTCTKTGIKTYKCTNCTNSYTEVVPALGHNYTERVTKAATCTESGIKTYTCSRCNERYSTAVSALGHNYKTTIKKATPTEGGYSDTVCTRCGYEHYKYIDSPDAFLTRNVFEYNGKTKKPKVKVYKGGGSDSYLSKENYTIVYPKESKKLGTFTVKVVLKGEYYSGTFKLSFDIKPMSVKHNKIKTKPYSKEEISASWKKIKGVDGYVIYRWSDKKCQYVKYKKTKKTSIKIKRENKKNNMVDFAIATYIKQGKKTYESGLVGGLEWVKLSAPTFKIEQNEIKEFTMVFPYEDFYYIQYSNNSDFSVDDKNTSKNYWVKTGMYADKNNDPAKKASRIRVFGLKANQTVYVRARKVYYNKKGKIVLGPWSKAKKVITY